MSVVGDLVCKTVKEKGWLAIDSIYFDNAVITNVFTTRGYVAISQSLKCLIGISSLDILDTDAIHNSIASYNPQNLGHGQSVYIGDLDSIQRFSLATYGKISMSGKSDGVFEMPRLIPNVKSGEDIAKVLEALADGHLECKHNDDKPIVVSVFSDAVREADQSWFNLEYLRDVWFPNKRKFEGIISAYLGLPAGDLI